MGRFTSVADRDAIEAEAAYGARDLPVTLHQAMTRIAARSGARPAASFQILSDPRSKAVTLTWSALLRQATQAANLFRSLGVGEGDVVAYLLPNSLETVVTLIGGAVAGVVNPINPLLEATQIAAILRETRAKVLVTLRAFPKTDVAEKAAAAVANAPEVRTVLEVDLNGYLSFPKNLIVPLIRPKVPVHHTAAVRSFATEMAKMPADRLSFADSTGDRVAALFHTGGTTGMPKVAQHKYSGMIYNGWCGANLLFEESDVLLCPLPLFHVFAAYPILMSCIMSGAHVVFPTPAGYRGEGVFDNFWHLIARWKASFMITVPTALSALMQRPVNADVSSLKTAISGSAPLPLELYNRFEKATGVQVAEGYGLTEATCLVSCNPVAGRKKVGSVGVPMPYSEVRILKRDGNGGFLDCAIDEVGEICVSNPGVFEGSTYTEVDKNHDLFAAGRFLRTGDLGRIDTDGYLWITGRAKDLIIRGGHNIDPAVIEEALAGHPAVAMVGAIGQPDAFAGELPCAYVELVKDAKASVGELLDYARARIQERAAVPKHLEIVPELPKTAVGKVFKPALRKLAIARVLGATLAEKGVPATIVAVVEDKKRGLVAQVRMTASAGKAGDGKAGDGKAGDGRAAAATLEQTLGEFAVPWELEGKADR